VIRDRVARAALYAYPSGVRASRGPEMLGALLDASADSRLAFVREIANLTRVGLHTRAAATAAVGTRRLVADACCRGALLIIAVYLAARLSWGPGIGVPAPRGTVVVLLPASLALGLIGYDRAGGVGALAWLVLAGPWQPLARHGIAAHLAAVAVPVVCFATMTIAPRRRRPDVRRLAWLAMVAPIAVLCARGGPPDVVGIAAVVTLVLGVLLVVAILPTDPRPAIACALLLAAVALAHQSVALRLGVGPTAGLPALLMTITAPLVIAIAAIRTRALRQAGRV
jgi:hypothetical protein